MAKRSGARCRLRFQACMAVGWFWYGRGIVFAPGRYDRRQSAAGTSVGFLLTLLLVGTLMTLVSTFVGYRDHVFPYRIIEGRLQSSGAEPLRRAAEDLPE